MKKRKLRIGQIAPINLPIPPAKYGGTERIVEALANGLPDLGHEVFLFASAGSKTKSKLIPVVEKSLWMKGVTHFTPYISYEMSLVIREARRLKLDILHDHVGPRSLAMYGAIDMPIVHTQHVPLNPDRAWAYKKLNAKLVSISNNQRKDAPDLNYVATVYNGTDTGIFKFQEKHKDYFLFLGELSPRKGIMEAIQTAKTLRAHLVVAGRVPQIFQKEDYAFFKKYVAPELANSKITYVGEVDHHKAAKLYGGAKATLFPIKWEEPFGLVMIESMSCGTPVIAFHRGSVPEVIETGYNGFVVNNVSQMVAAAKKIDQISRFDCRQSVEKHFSNERMVENYEKLYYRLAR